MGKEPTLIVQSIVAALNVVQLSALSMSTLAHVLILATIGGLGAFVNRATVRPHRRPAKATPVRHRPPAGVP